MSNEKLGDIIKDSNQRQGILMTVNVKPLSRYNLHTARKIKQERFCRRLTGPSHDYRFRSS